MTDLRLAAAAALFALGAAPAVAQTVPTAARSPSHAVSTMQTARNPNQNPAFHVLGVPVVIQAPVNAPYNSADAYSTYAGQPGQGPNALLKASLSGTP